MHFEYIHKEQYPQVAAIYKAGLATGIATFETEVPDWETWNAKYLPYGRITLLENQEMIGWAALTPTSSRAVYRGVAEVSIYIHPNWRGKKMGDLLLAKLITDSEAHGIWSLQSSIFTENIASLKLHHRMGFRTIGFKEKIAQRHGKWHDNTLLEKRSQYFMENTFLPKIANYIDTLVNEPINEERKAVLKPLIAYIQEKVDKHEMVNLNFICTHNSRRSQFSQIWAQVAAAYHHIAANCFSGGVEVTAFNERAVAAMERAGFSIQSAGTENPTYELTFAIDKPAITAFSKLFDDPTNEADRFAAIMTCSHADENCPHIPKTEQRIPVRYEDPKAFDDTPQEAEMYDARCRQIAAELLYAFGQVNTK